MLDFAYGEFKLAPRSAYDIVYPACEAEKCLADLLEGDLVITELMYNPAIGDDNYNEWVELYNSTADSINARGIRFQDLSGNRGFISEDVVIPPGEFAVFAIDDGSDWAYTTFFPSAYYGGAMQLTNGGDELSIFAGEVELDWVPEYPSGVPGMSWQLAADMYDMASNDSTDNWCLSSAEIESYMISDDEVGAEIGTPASANSSCM